MRELDERAMELAQAEEDCRRAINVATKDYNKALVSCVLDNAHLFNSMIVKYLLHSWIILQGK